MSQVETYEIAEVGNEPPEISESEQSLLVDAAQITSKLRQMRLGIEALLENHSAPAYCP